MLGHAHKVQQSHSISSPVLELSLLMMMPTAQRLIIVTANEIPSIEPLIFRDAEPFTIEVHITAEESIMIELQPTGSSGTTSGADSSGSKLVAEPDMMPMKLERFGQVAYAIRFSALGVDSGGAVSAMAVSDCTSCTAVMTAGGATLGVNSGGATSKYAIRFSALGVDSGGAVSTIAVSGCTSCTADMTAGRATLGVNSGGSTSKVDSSDAVSENPIPGCTSCTAAVTADGATLRVDSGGAISTTAVPGYTGCTAARSTGGAMPGVDSGGAPSRFDSGGVMSELDLGDAVSTDIKSGATGLGANSGGAMFTCCCTRRGDAICAGYAQDVVSADNK